MIEPDEIMFSEEDPKKRGATPALIRRIFKAAVRNLKAREVRIDRYHTTVHVCRNSQAFVLFEHRSRKNCGFQFRVFYDTKTRQIETINGSLIGDPTDWKERLKP